MTPAPDRYTFGDREHVALRMLPCIAPTLRESESDKHFADNDEEPQMSDMRVAAKAYLDAGYQIVPLRPGTKKITDDGWPERFYSIDTVQSDGNLGTKCLTPVIDIDCHLLLRQFAGRDCADDFLPTTPRIDGRVGKPRSHRAYVADLTAEDFKNLDGTMLVQILAGRGKQAVVPPSLWVDDENPQHQERRAWVDGSLIGPPASAVEGPFLRTRVAYIATVALMALYWPKKGIRRELRLAYARVLLETLKLDVAVATRILEWACRLGGSDDNGVKHAASAVRDTRDALDKDEKAIGAATVTKLLPEVGEKLIARLREWFGVTALGAEIVIHRASDVPDEKLEKVFGGRFVRGSFALVAGPGEGGKGMFMVDTAARFTAGAPFPGEKARRDPAAVLLCVTEDSMGRVKSRLRAAGANLDLAFFVEGPEVTRGGLTMASPMMLDDDAGKLVRYARQIKAQACLIETMVEHFGDRGGKASRRSTNNEADVRSALSPFRAMCAAAGLYGEASIHPRKTMEGSIDDSISGSAAFRNVTRVAHHIYRDPEDESDNPVRLLFTSKSNYLSRRPATLRFRIRSWDEGLAGPCMCPIDNCGHEGRIVWEADLVDERLAEEIWQQIAERNRPRRDVNVQEAEAFLTGLMQGGIITLPPQEIFKLANAEGITKAAVKRAKENLRLVSKKEGFPAAVIGWQVEREAM